VLKGWPKAMRLIVRKERPHPGAQLRFTDADGLRLTAFATNTTTLTIAALELRHRQRARAEDRIRNAAPPACATCPCTKGAEPDLAGDRADRPGPAGLDAHARPDRRNPQVGTPPASAPPLLRRRPDSHDRPPPTPEIRTPLALDRRHHGRDQATRCSPKTLDFDAGRFPPTPPACYRVSWQLPGPDSQRQATTSLRTAINHLHGQPPSSAGRTNDRDQGLAHARACTRVRLQVSPPPLLRHGRDVRPSPGDSGRAHRDACGRVPRGRRGPVAFPRSARDNHFSWA
jgi:hypothetical protein